MILPLATSTQSPQTKRIQRNSRLKLSSIIPVFLAKHCLASVFVPPDGNCLHRAVGVGLYGEGEPLYFRNTIVSFDETNVDHVFGFTPIAVIGIQSVYSKTLARCKLWVRWGSELQLAIACRTLHLSIVVVTSGYITAYEALIPLDMQNM